jgi:RHS repeat-associated protein
VVRSDGGALPYATCATWDPTQGLQPGVFQEYRYDALNRRVFVSALFAPDCGSTCHDYTEQTIWDGDQVLGEIRTGGGFQQSGTVAYTHGGGLDAPLSLVRHGLTSGPVTVVPHSNWRGQYHAGSYTDGAVAGNSRLDLREVRWPAENAGAYLNPLRPFRRDAPWMGSLVQSSEDASGLMYRRNRYYDPKTGRFTQEDPIGLAGGLNTYGFADGDPVSYDDPYGLACVEKGKMVPCPQVLVGLVVTGLRTYSVAARARVFSVGNALRAGVYGLPLLLSGDTCPTCRTEDQDRNRDEVLTRFGSDPETAESLQSQAGAAASAGFPHGVSVTARNTPHGAKAPRSVVQRQFPVHNTPTRRDKLHRTVELPNPVTQQDADRFNRTFGRIP